MSMGNAASEFNEFRFVSRRDGTSTQWRIIPQGGLQLELHKARRMLGNSIELEYRKTSVSDPIHKGNMPYILAIAGQVKENKQYLDEHKNG